MSNKPRVFEKGGIIENMAVLSLWLGGLNSWVYLNDKVLHPSFLTSMSYRTIEGYVKAGHVFRAWRIIP